MTKFALLVALALACGEAGALKCFFCSSVLPNCEESPDTKYLTECPAPPTGQASRCSKLDGVQTLNDVTEKGTVRGCINYPTSSKLLENKCYIDNDALNLLKELADTSIIPIDGSVSFKGNLCFCDTDQCNSVAAVQPFLGLLVAAVGLCVMGVWR